MQDSRRTIARVGRRRDGRSALYVFGHGLRYATFGFRGTGRCAAVRLSTAKHPTSPVSPVGPVSPVSPVSPVGTVGGGRDGGRWGRSATMSHTAGVSTGSGAGS